MALLALRDFSDTPRAKAMSDAMHSGEEGSSALWDFVQDLERENVRLRESKLRLLGQTVNGTGNADATNTGSINDPNATAEVSRVEVIDDSGRAYVARGAPDDVRVWCSLQDQGRTLKVFIDGAQQSRPAAGDSEDATAFRVLRDLLTTEPWPTSDPRWQYVEAWADRGCKLFGVGR